MTVLNSSDEAVFAFNEAVTPHESRLSRTMSPIAVVVILLDDIASVSPLDLVKRTSIPTTVTWLVLILAFQKLGSHFKSVTPQAQSLHCQASVNLPAFLVNHLLCWQLSFELPAEICRNQPHRTDCHRGVISGLILSILDSQLNNIGSQDTGHRKGQCQNPVIHTSIARPKLFCRVAWKYTYTRTKTGSNTNQPRKKESALSRCR